MSNPTRRTSAMVSSNHSLAEYRLLRLQPMVSFRRADEASPPRNPNTLVILDPGVPRTLGNWKRAALAEKASHPCSYPGALHGFYAPLKLSAAQPLPAVDLIVMSHLEIQPRIWIRSLRGSAFEHGRHIVSLELHRFTLACCSRARRRSRPGRAAAALCSEMPPARTLRLGVVNAVIRPLIPTSGCCGTRVA